MDNNVTGIVRQPFFSNENTFGHEPPESLFFSGPSRIKGACEIIAKVTLSDLEQGKPSFIQYELARTLASGIFSRRDIVKAKATELVKDKEIFNKMIDLYPEFVDMLSILKELEQNNLKISENSTPQELRQLGFKAVQKGCVNLLRCLIHLQLVEPFAIDEQHPMFFEENGNSMLIQAIHAEKNNGIIAKILIDAGANVNFTNLKNESPLIIAVRNQQEEIVNMLIEQGANVNVKDSRGRPALMVAAKSIPFRIFRGRETIPGDVIWKALIQAGANVTAQDHEGHTAFWYAMKIAGEYPYVDITRLINEFPFTAESLKVALKQMIVKDTYNPTYDRFAQIRMPIIRILIDKGAKLDPEDHEELSNSFSLSVLATYREVQKLLNEKVHS